MIVRTAVVCAAFGALAFFAYPPSVGSMPVDDYLRTRREQRYDPKVTYAQVEADPGAYAKTIVEVRGVVSGSIQRAQSVSFLLTLDDGKSLLLPAPQSEVPVVTSATRPRLRVLARVTTGVVGNVTPLEVIAVAYDADVLLREEQAAAKEAALKEQAERRRAAQAAQAARPASPTGSGYSVRALPVAGLSEMARKYLSPEAQNVYPAYLRFIQNHNKRLSAKQADEIAVGLLYFCARHEVDPRLAVALIIAESDFNPNSTSHAGAMGLGQVMPDEARAFGLQNPYDPIQNVRASINMLRMKLDMYREPGVPTKMLTWRQVALAAAAYNAGAGAVKKYGGIPPYRETQKYVQRVISLYRELAR